MQARREEDDDLSTRAPSTSSAQASTVAVMSFASSRAQPSNVSERSTKKSKGRVLVAKCLWCGKTSEAGQCEWHLLE